MQPTSTPAVVIKSVSFAYPGGKTVLRDISLTIEDGEMLVVIGPNGGGKTTLLNLIVGLLPVQQGEIRIFGEPPATAQRRHLVGYVPQRHHPELAFPLSARQIVELAATQEVPPWRAPGRAVREHIDHCLELVHMADKRDVPIGRLSGGQLQRIFIARALASRPRMIVLDEPLMGLDPSAQDRFGKMIESLHRELKLTMVLVSHDLRTLAGGTTECDRVACLRGSLHFHAAPHGLTPQVVAEVFEHDLAHVFGQVHVDAHRADECTHDHAHGPETPPGDFGRDGGAR